MKKLKYEKPMSLDAGQVPAIQGACNPLGSSAMDGCIIGNNPNVAPVCVPTGNIADYNCGAGTTNLLGNCRAHGYTASGCSSGDDPLH